MRSLPKMKPLNLRQVEKQPLLVRHMLPQLAAEQDIQFRLQHRQGISMAGCGVDSQFGVAVFPLTRC